MVFLVDSARGGKKSQSLVHTANITARPLLGATSLIAIIAFYAGFCARIWPRICPRLIYRIGRISKLLSWILALVHVLIHSEHYLKIKTADDNTNIFNTIHYTENSQYAYIFLLHHKAGTIIGIVLAVNCQCLLLSVSLPQTFFSGSDIQTRFYKEYKIPEGTRIEKVERPKK